MFYPIQPVLHSQTVQMSGGGGFGRKMQDFDSWDSSSRTSDMLLG